MKMNRSRIARLSTLLFCSLGLASCAVPGQTRASWLLQGDIQNMINANELAHGHVFGGKVVNTKFISIDEQTITEHWIVKRGRREVTYVVRMTPSPRGGTDFEVTLPEEDRLK